MFGRKKTRLADVTRTTVVLHLDGESIAGILLEEYDDVVAVVRARLLSEASGRAVPLDGEILIPRERIRFVQVGVKLDDTRRLELAQAEGSRSA